MILKEAVRTQVLQEYLGKVVSDLEQLPRIIKYLKIFDSSNTLYTLRYITLNDDTVLFYLDHISTNIACSNKHHQGILKEFHISKPDIVPTDAGYLEFDNGQINVINLTKTGSTLQDYQLTYDQQSRQHTIDILSPTLSKIGYVCQARAFKTPPSNLDFIYLE